MKKIMVALLVIVSLVSLSDPDAYDNIENKLEAKYHFITDGKRQLKIDEIDIDSLNGKIYVNIEIKSTVSDGGWSKFNKNKYKENVTKIADDIRASVGTADKISISLILDRKVGKDLLLDEGEY